MKNGEKYLATPNENDPYDLLFLYTVFLLSLLCKAFFEWIRYKKAVLSNLQKKGPFIEQ